MPTFISEMGIWKPAKERNVSPDGEIYNGPDRAAKELLTEQGVSSLGQDVRKDPENLIRARQLNMSIDEFLGLNDAPTEETLKQAEKTKNFVQTHKASKKKRGVTPQGGGVTQSGGFGDPT